MADDKKPETLEKQIRDVAGLDEPSESEESEEEEELKAGAEQPTPTGDETTPPDKEEPEKPADEKAGEEDGETGEERAEEEEAEKQASDEADAAERLLGRAKEEGFDADEIEAFGDNLEKALDAIDRRFIEAYRPSRDDAAKPEREEAPAAERERPARKEPEAEDELTPLDLTLDETELEPEVVKAFNALKARDEKLVGALNEMRGRFADIAKGEAAKAEEQQETIDRWYDERFNALDGEWESVFGKGSGRDIRTAQFGARRDVSLDVAALAKRYETQGKTIPPIEELFQRALRASHGDRVVKAKVKEAEETKDAERESYKKRGIGRPSARKRKPGTPQERAEARWDGFTKKRDRATQQI